MPCLLALLALFIPRVVIIVIYIFSDWFEAAFDSALWPILGFIFAPATLLWYSVVVNVYGGVWSLIPIAGLVITILIDISPAYRKR